MHYLKEEKRELYPQSFCSVLQSERTALELWGSISSASRSESSAFPLPAQCYWRVVQFIFIACPGWCSKGPLDSRLRCFLLISFTLVLAMMSFETVTDLWRLHAHTQILILKGLLMVKTWGWLNLLLWLTAALALDFGQYIIPLWYIKTELSRWCKEESSWIKH